MDANQNNSIATPHQLHSINNRGGTLWPLKTQNRHTPTRNKPGISQSESDQSGFLIISAGILLSTIAIALMGQLALMVSINAVKEAQKICREELLSGHHQAAQTLNSLLTLNPMATALRLARAQALAEVAAAPNLAQRATALGKLAKINSQQMLLRQKQKSLHQLFLLQMKSSGVKASAALNQKNISSKRPRTRQPRLKLVPPDSLTPDYLPNPRFEADSSTPVTWTRHLFGLLPASWHRWIGTPNMFGRCDVHLKKKGTIWVSHLNRANL